MDSLTTFNSHRNHLFGIAYRMLGSVMAAEDALQETFLRWQQTDITAVRSARAYLTTVLTPLCLDQLKSAQARREVYPGPWLPEPLVTTPSPDDTLVLAESLSMAFLVLLEQLTPVERAVFLLREVFDYPYGEVARLVNKSEANCRQIVRRTRQRLADKRPRFRPSPQQQQRLMSQFLATCVQGDLPGLIAMLAEDITVWADGGGNVAAARNPVYGADRVARYLLGVIPRLPPDSIYQAAEVNHQPAIIVYLNNRRPYAVLLVDVSDEQIQNIHIVLNPDKLHHLPPTPQ